MDSLTRQIELVNAMGLHARAAARISKIAQTAVSRVWLLKDGEAVDASCVLDILSLACPKGSTLTVKIDDPSDMNVLAQIECLVAGGFGEC